MRGVFTFLFASLLLLATNANADNHKPNLDLEKKIAYQQGQFGGLYARCAKGRELSVIGGSINAWRKETFSGYKGTNSESSMLTAAFDNAAKDVQNDPNACDKWVEQAAVTWRSIRNLATRPK